MSELNGRDEGMRFEPGGRWWVAENNLLNLVRGQFQPPSKVTFLDCTLREGEETPGAYLPFEKKLRLAEELEAAGLTELEVGYVGAIEEHLKLVGNLKRAGIKAKISSHNRTYGRENEWREEIERTIDAGTDIITFVGFASETMLKSCPWLTREALPERFANCVSVAKELGATVAFSLAASDLGRVSLESIAQYYRIASEAGADRIYVSDGTGGLTPETVAFFTRFVRDVIGPRPKIALHLHNSYGLATANALAGVLNGAECVDCCVLGLGDAAGISALEEVATALESLYGIDTGIDLTHITQLAKTTEEVFEICVSPNKAVVGKNIFRHQIDSHIASILRGGWQAWEVVRAEALGRERKLEWARGKLRRGKSGGTGAKIEQLGLTASDEQFAEISEQIGIVAERDGFASESTVEQIIRRVLTGANA